MTSNINWQAYYQKEPLISDFNPETDALEIHRCLAAWSVFPRQKIDSLLDVECGDGYFCHWIKQNSNIDKVMGIDISEARLERARSRYPEIKYIKGSFPNLPADNNSFDLVSCIEVLEHMEDPLEALKELARITRKYVLITVPDRQVIKYNICPHCLKKFPADGHLHSFDVPKIRILAQNSNLIVEKTSSYYLPVDALSTVIPLWAGKALRKMANFISYRPGTFLAARLRKI